jgi:hypothetical protein
LKHGTIEIGHSSERYMTLMYWSWTYGNTTRGIEQHLQWAMAAISSEPDSRILAHPIKIAAGNWTAVTGILPGNVTMVTVAHWEDGRIAEEYLFTQGSKVMD